MEDAVYELDSPKSFGAPSFDRRKHGSYGITVTKVEHKGTCQNYVCANIVAGR
jgi:hypothetical protein